MSDSLLKALVAFIPAVLLFSLSIIARWHRDDFVTALLIIELGFAVDCSRRMIAFKRTHGNFPFSMRVPLLPWMAGGIVYILIASGTFRHPASAYVGLLAAFAIAASKLWFGRGPIWLEGQRIADAEGSDMFP